MTHNGGHSAAGKHTGNVATRFTGPVAASALIGGSGRATTVRMAPSLVKPVNGLVNGSNNGNGSPTAPLPKAAIDYQLPDNIGMKEAQALLARKLDEARVIIREPDRAVVHALARPHLGGQSQ